MKPIILIAGKTQSGKDTAFSVMHAAWGGRQVAFADELKRWLKLMAYEVGNLTIDPWNNKTVEVRQAMQLLGDTGRALDPHFWVQYALVNAMRSHDAVVYLTDARYPAEIEFTQEFCAKHGRPLHIVRMRRPEGERVAAIFEKYGDKAYEIMQHSSETALDDYPFPASTVEIFASSVSHVKLLVGAWMRQVLQEEA